jgi:PIN domain nuclease of toxin-antitoxin system
MSKIVLDASAIMAIIQNEAGHEKLTIELLAGSSCSSVNLAEVQAKLVSQGWTQDDAWEDATGPVDEIVPFDAQQAKTSGDLITQTNPFGLSLGDRACLALGIALNAPVYTTDKMWKKLKLGIPIQVIR